MKRAKINSIWLFPIVIMLILSGCFPAQRLADQNISSIYQISDNTPLPSYTVYQFHSDSLRLFFSIPPKRPRADEEQFQAPDDYRLFVSIFPSDNKNAVIDSATYHYSRNSLSEGQELRGSIDLFTGNPSGRVLSVYLSDMASIGANEQLFPLIEAFPPGRYHYYLVDEQQSPLTSVYLRTGMKFTVRSSIIGDQDVQVRFYEDDYPVALPPFSVVPLQYFDYNADSLFQVTFRNGETALLQFDRPGIYHFNADANQQAGFIYSASLNLH
ncbi:MAG: hypothetical protein R6V49_01770 [Bacteroidales bacterium]